MNKFISFCVLVILLFFLLPLFTSCFISLEEVKTYSEILQNLGIGIGALFGGLGGLKILLDYGGTLEKKRKIDKLRQRYPVGKQDQSYELVEPEEAPGTIYIHDKKLKKLLHIGSDSTLRDLNFTRNNIKKLDKKAFNKIEKGETILTSGEFGS